MATPLEDVISEPPPTEQPLLESPPVEPPHARAPQTESMSLPQMSLPHKRSIVLLVDDNKFNLKVLFETLNQDDLRLLVAESGEEALERVNRLKPDIILLDVMMPGLNGFETCERLKADLATADIPVVFMTALADTVSKVEGLAMGAVDYITKPIQPDEVLARVRTHLRVHHLQQQLQDRNKQLKREIEEREQVEQSLRLLHRSVSHDLKNPVNGMIMVLNNLLNGVGTVPQASNTQDANTGDVIGVPRKILERMVKSSDRQLQLINSLLDSSSSQTVVELNRQPMCVADLIDSVSQDIQPLLTQHPATIKYDLSECLPLVYADPTQIWRVFENLITNAIKHNPPNVEVSIAVHPDQPNVSGDDVSHTSSPSSPCTLRCEIKDNGVGIPPEAQRTLFHPYQRGTEVKQAPGLGLGLYLCRQIIETHGGEIGVISQPQQGTTFWFTVPCLETNCTEMG